MNEVIRITLPSEQTDTERYREMRRTTQILYQKKNNFHRHDNSRKGLL